MRRSITSFIALAATSALLVADSAGPQCADYETFRGSFAFESTCGGGTSGQMTLDVGTDSMWSEPLVESKASAEGVTIANVYADYDYSECTMDEPSGTGRIHAVDFELHVERADSGFEPGYFTCLGIDVHEQGVQLLPCVPFDPDADKCTVTLTPL